MTTGNQENLDDFFDDEIENPKKDEAKSDVRQSKNRLDSMFGDAPPKRDDTDDESEDAGESHDNYGLDEEENYGLDEEEASSSPSLPGFDSSKSDGEEIRATSKFRLDSMFGDSPPPPSTHIEGRETEVYSSEALGLSGGDGDTDEDAIEVDPNDLTSRQTESYDFEEFKKRKEETKGSPPPGAAGRVGGRPRRSREGDYEGSSGGTVGEDSRSKSDEFSGSQTIESPMYGGGGATFTPEAEKTRKTDFQRRPPQGLGTPSVLDEGSDSLGVDALSAAIDKVDGGKGSPNIPYGFITALGVIVGVIAVVYLVVVPKFLVSDKQKLKVQVGEALADQDFEKAIELSAKLEGMKLTSEEQADLDRSFAQALLNQIEEVRKDENFNKGAQSFSIYIQHFGQALQTKFHRETQEWLALLDSKIAAEKFKSAYQVYKALSPTLDDKDFRRELLIRMERAYIDFLAQKDNPRNLLKALQLKLTLTSQKYLIELAREKAESISKKDPQVAVSFLLTLAEKNSELDRLIREPIRRYNFQHWLERSQHNMKSGFYNLAHICLDNARQIYPHHREIKALERALDQYYRKQASSIRSNWPLVQKGIRATESQVPYLSKYYMEEVKNREMPGQVRALLAPYAKYVERLRGMAFVPGQLYKGKVVKPFYISRREVTNREYGRFLTWMKFQKNAGFAHSIQRQNWPDKSHTPDNWEQRFRQYPDHPVVGVDWYDTYAYARWAGKRLPTALEWQIAAQGKLVHKYPWGNDFDSHRANTSYSSTLPVGTFPKDKSSYQCLDMAGNVREWLADELPMEKDTPEEGHAIKRWVGGGCFKYKNPEEFTSSHKKKLPANHRDMATGFRCAMDKLKVN